MTGQQQVKRISLSDIKRYADFAGVNTYGCAIGEVINEIFKRLEGMSAADCDAMEASGKDMLEEITASKDYLAALIKPDTQAMDWICLGPLVNDCTVCEGLGDCLKGYLKWYSRLPHFVVDNYLPLLSPSAFKVFVYLNRRTNYEEGHQHFGRCWLTFKELSEATGVKKSNMRTYVKELQRHGLIEYSWSRMGGQEGVKTIHSYTITWLRAIRRLKQAVKEKEAAMK